MKKILNLIELIKSRKVYYIPFVYIIIVLLACSPIIIAMFAGLFGNCLGCNINEGGSDDCIRLGIPLGTILSMFFVLGWFALLTIPIGAIAIVGWTIYCIIILIREKKNKAVLK